MQLPTDARTVLVIGKKRSGKSRAIKQGLALVPSFVVWDLRGEYAHPTMGVPGCRLWTSLADWRAHLRAGGRVERETFACSVAEFPAWCSWVFRTGNVLCVIEELGRYCGSGKPFPALADLLDRSRHVGVDLIAASPSLAGIPKGFVEQADELVIARTTEPNKLAYLEAWLGLAAATRIRNLPQGQLVRLLL